MTVEGRVRSGVLSVRSVRETHHPSVRLKARPVEEELDMPAVLFSRCVWGHANRTAARPVGCALAVSATTAIDEDDR
jgi:hypothetical protein